MPAIADDRSRGAVAFKGWFGKLYMVTLFDLSWHAVYGYVVVMSWHRGYAVWLASFASWLACLGKLYMVTLQFGSGPIGTMPTVADN